MDLPRRSWDRVVLLWEACHRCSRGFSAPKGSDGFPSCVRSLFQLLHPIRRAASRIFSAFLLLFLCICGSCGWRELPWPRIEGKRICKAASRGLMLRNASEYLCWGRRRGGTYRGDSKGCLRLVLFIFVESLWEEIIHYSVCLPYMAIH